MLLHFTRARAASPQLVQPSLFTTNFYMYFYVGKASAKLQLVRRKYLKFEDSHFDPEDNVFLQILLQNNGIIFKPLRNSSSIATEVTATSLII